MVSYAFTLENFEYWLLILVRIASFMVVAPFFGHSGVPNRVKIGFSMFIAILLYEGVERPVPEYDSVVGYALIVVCEGITGLLIGFAANICNSIVLFAGNIIDMNIGLSMATEYNPDMATEMTLTGNLYYYVIMLLLTTSDMQGYLLKALCDTYSVIPIGQIKFQLGALSESMLAFMGDIFVLGFRISLPFFMTMMILNCVLGIMAKVAPQMNMFAIGMQLKILVGYGILFVTYFLMPRVSNMIFQEIKLMVTRFAEGMY